MTTPRLPTEYRCPKCGAPYSPAVGCPREAEPEDPEAFTSSASTDSADPFASDVAEADPFVSMPPIATDPSEAPCNVRIGRQTLSRAAPPALRRLAAWLHVAATPCDCGRCRSELLERLARVRGFC